MISVYYNVGVDGIITSHQETKIGEYNIVRINHSPKYGQCTIEYSYRNQKRTITGHSDDKIRSIERALHYIFQIHNGRDGECIDEVISRNGHIGKKLTFGRQGIRQAAEIIGKEI